MDFTSAKKKINSVLVLLACLHDQNKSGFLEGRLFSSQSELLESFSKGSD